MAAFDFAIIGSTPLAGLLAGLLAGELGPARVCLVSERISSLRLPRGVDLGAGAFTRPESWSLLTSTLSESSRLISRIGGRGALVRLDPLVFAESVAAALALSHVRHMALAFGLAVERAPTQGLPAVTLALRLRDIAYLDRAQFMAGLGRWVEAAGVVRIARSEVQVSTAAAGGGRLVHGGEVHEVTRLVLADDDAILTVLGAAAVSGWLGCHSTTSVLTEPAATLAAPVMVAVDRGVSMVQRNGGNIAAIVASGPMDSGVHLGICLRAQAPLRLAGQTSFTALTSHDGAPVVGPLGSNETHVIAGLAPIGAFLAPVLARGLAGRETAAERQWLEARRPHAAGERAAVAEFGGAAAKEAAA